MGYRPRWSLELGDARYWQARRPPRPEPPGSSGWPYADRYVASRSCAPEHSSTFASNALAAGISVFELARIMGTSVMMIERHYGTLIEGAAADITRRLDAFDAKQARGLERDQEA